MKKSRTARALTFLVGTVIAAIGVYIAYLNQTIEMNTILFVSLGGVFMGIDPTDLTKKK